MPGLVAAPREGGTITVTGGERG